MHRVLAALLSVIVFCSTANGQASTPGPRIKNGYFTSSNSLLNRSFNHPLWKSAQFEGNYYVVLQMENIPDPQQKLLLTGNGIRLEQFLQGKNWLAICTPGFSKKNLQALGIRNIYSISPALKISASLRDKATLPAGPKDLIAVHFFPVDRKLIEKTLETAGVEQVETKIKPVNTWFIRGTPEELEKLAKIPFVSSISPLHLEDVPLNYNNHAIHSVNSLSNLAGRNLFGKNLVIGIGDNANPTSHIDLAGKVIMRTDQPVADHGTHTSGILAGGGIINPLYAGMAPRARLVMNDFSNIIVNTPTYVADYNMPITNNSYYNGTAACPGEGDYNELSNYVDYQELAYPKLLHVFAAGNDGLFTCTPYPLSFATIKSGFQTGKNVLTVGNMNNATYGIGITSSRGPVKDGRLKPDIVAGGVSITSTYSNNNYGVSSGTSMACPTAAGILTLITERYRQLHGGLYPDGALLKALAMNSADDLGNPGPDFTFGYGMINSRTTVEALEQNHYFNGTVSNNASQSFTIPSLPAGMQQLKILLYWPDAPALPMASTTLVNDLDLEVTEPGGTIHQPLVLDPSAAGFNNNAVESADHTNNAEQVVINNPLAGDYSLTIKGTSIPSGPQGFYIAYEVIQPSVTVEYPFGSETWVPGESENIRWSAYGGDPNSFTLEYSVDGGSNWITINNAIPAASRSYTWTVPALATNKALIRVTRNTAGYSDTSDFPFTILAQPLLTVTATCPGYAQLNWNTIAGADAYDVLKLSGDTMQVIAQTNTTSFLSTPLNQNTEYWFSVRAVQGGVAGRRAIGRKIIPNSGTCSAAALNNDLMVDSLLTPQSGRQFTSSQPGTMRISIRVRNPGAVATVSPVNYSYQVNGGAIVTETSAVPLPANALQVFTFSPANSFDFSAPGRYDIKTWILYAPDTIPGNDTLCTSVKNLRNDPLVLSPSFTEGFESAVNESYAQRSIGLDSLERTDFFLSGANGRLNTFFNSGFARTGNRSMLLDVNAQGTNAADSMVNTFNLSNYTASDQLWLDLYFKKQSAVPALPGNQVWIRGNDLASWIPVKSLSDPLDLPGNYIKLNLDLTGILASASPAQTISSSFQVRTGYEGKSPATSADPSGLPGGGIVFDDFILTNAQNDVGMRRIIQPALKNICALGNAEKITILIKNYGNSTVVNIPVSYAVNQDTVTEFVPALAAKDSLQYTFTKPADMSVYQAYHIKTWVSDPADNYRNNDSSGDFIIQTSPLINQYPYLEGFEQNNGFWFAGGLNSSWQWGQPAKPIIHKSANGSNAWVTSLTGNYNDNEYSFLYSPCFDLTALTRPVLSFSHIFQTEDDCNCDYHWVEYSLDDSVWTLLGNATTGINWYDNAIAKAWQKSDTGWHVSSYDVPVNPGKIRFRIVIFSDQGSNKEGIGIDDIHIFEKAPVFEDSLSTSQTQPVQGINWINFDENGKRLFSILPNGQDLGNTRMVMFRDTAAIRDTAGQYYAGRNWVIQTANPATAGLRVRYYFTDKEAKKLINASGCISCLNTKDPYEIGVTQYSSTKIIEEDSTLKNNLSGNYLFHKPGTDVQVIPFDNGYYAEMSVSGFSEFWLNGGGKYQDHPLAASWLKEFTAILQNSDALLSWTSWQEIGSLKYIIERSPDSIQFTKIGEVPAIPHMDSTQSYQFTDTSLLNGNNYYRLVLYFQNADSLISPVRKVFYEGIPVIVQAFPNPTTGPLTIKTPSACREIQIFDVLGRKLMDKPVQGYIQQISIASFPRAVYFLKLFTDSGNKLIKLEKR